jgi:hypothetical protein
MSYVHPDYNTKKAFREAIKAGIQHGTYNPSGMFPTTSDGTLEKLRRAGLSQDVIEGPHYPKPHRWHARVVVKDGIVVSAK